MAAVESYSHLTTATVPQKAWDQVWFVLQSWRGYLQSFPGHLTTRISAASLENGDVRIFVWTVWRYPEELEEWRESQYSMDSILSQIEPPILNIQEQTLEDFA